MGLVETSTVRLTSETITRTLWMERFRSGAKDPTAPAEVQLFLGGLIVNLGMMLIDDLQKAGVLEGQAKGMVWKQNERKPHEDVGGPIIDSANHQIAVLPEALKEDISKLNRRREEEKRKRDEAFLKMQEERLDRVGRMIATVQRTPDPKK